MASEDFFEPSDAHNFLQRYHEARSSSSPTSPTQSVPVPVPTPASPVSPSSSATAASPPSPRRQSSRDIAKTIWGSVFHPLGKSPTTADRYDLSRGQTSVPGMSASEVHAKGTGISLDAPQEDM